MQQQYLLISSALLTLASCQTSEKEKQPNIIFMLTDDHSTQAITCYGGTLVQTPNLDRIANEGMRFDNFYATNALSGPSRACILTGKYSHVNGFIDNASTFDGNQETFPKLLQQVGYQTAIIGKWHLISEPQGFDFWSILSGLHEQGNYYQPEFIENGKEIVEPGYVTDVITDKTIKFIENRDKSKPFCIMYHQKAPHRNWMPAQRHLGKFNDVVFEEPFNLFDDYETRSRAAHEQDMNIAHTLQERWDLKIATEEEMNDTTLCDKYYKAYHRMTKEEQKRWNEVYAGRVKEYREKKMSEKELVSWKYQQYIRDYLATALAVDENIGRLLDYLEDIGELDNTIIIYASDQGFFLGEHGWFDKRFMYEECMQMPFLVRYPKAIQSGKTSDAMCMNIDVAPTLLDYANVKIPETIQGKSLRPILENNGKEPEKWRQYAYYHYFEFPAEHSVKRHYGIRTKDHKLIHFYNDIDEWEMYNLNNDPHEMENIYNQPTNQAVQTELKKMLFKVREEIGDN